MFRELLLNKTVRSDEYIEGTATADFKIKINNVEYPVTIQSDGY